MTLGADIIEFHPDRIESLKVLQQTLGYSFCNLKILNLALTHSSYGAENNQRLEYLGDSVLRMIISDELYEQHPEFGEGTLTQERALRENNQHLASIARKLDFEHHMLVGKSAKKEVGSQSDNPLAGAFEAVLGAIYLDGGLDPVRNIVSEHVMNCEIAERHPKSLLQEKLAQDHGIVPTYSIKKSVGPDHNKYFHVRCVVDRFELETSGVGPSIKRAESIAAAKMLDLLP